MTTGLSFAAWRDGDYVTLADLLRLLGETIRNYTWKAKIEEVAPHPKAEAFEAMLRNYALNTAELLAVADWDVQIIDGEVIGYADPEQTAAITIRAVDSTSWDILSPDPSILSTFANAYADALPIP